jgi:peptidoglycan/xylan/chitin deacetylase (PgdA/CDA1 family)
MKLVALGYHTISSDGNGNKRLTELSLPPELFEAHMRLLMQEGYVFFRFRDIDTLRDNNKPLPSRAALVYFDDGYRGVREYAYPLLKKFSISATCFVTTGFIDRTTEPSWEHGSAEHTPLFLTWEELRAMQDVFEIGSHAATHQRFTKLSSEQAQQELAVSRKRIGERLGVLPVAFSFPHSAWQKENKRAVLAAGYRIAVGVGRGYNYNPDMQFLKKIPIGPRDDAQILRRKLRYLPLMELWRRVTGLFLKL